MARHLVVGLDDHAGRVALGLEPEEGVLRALVVGVLVDELQRLNLDDRVRLLHLEAHHLHRRDVRRPDLVVGPAEVRDLLTRDPVVPARRVAQERPDVLDGRLDADLAL